MADTVQSGVGTGNAKNVGKSQLRVHPGFWFAGIWMQLVWFFWACGRLDFIQNDAGGFAGGAISWQCIFATLAVALLAIAGIVGGRHKKRSEPLLRLDVFAIALMLAATLIIGNTWPGMERTGQFIMGAIFGGFGLSWSFLLWGTAYGWLGIYDMVACVLASMLIAPAASSALSLLPTIPAMVVACILPLASVGAARFLMRHHKDVASKTVYQPGNLKSLVKLGICIASFSFVTSAITAATIPSPFLVSSHHFLAGRGIEILCGAALLYWVFPHNGSFDFARIWKWILASISVYLLLIVFVPPTELVTSLAFAVFVATTFLLWAALADIARRTSFHPSIVIGVGWSIFAIPCFLGCVLVHVLGLASNLPMLAVVLLVILVITVAVCLNSDDPDMANVFADLRPPVVAPADYPRIDERCEALSRRYNLSARETEVMAYLGKGRSRTYIAEALFLSEGNVRHDTRKIFSKLGIHTRRELFDLMEPK